MRFLKRFLPFALAFLVGVAAFSLFLSVRRERARREVRLIQVTRTVPVVIGERELPELRVLSPMMMDEVLEFERHGSYESPRIISPPGPHYALPPRRDYRQGVLQLNFLFGADGRISEITPRDKPYVCGVCLQGPNVVRIDPRDPRSRELVEAAKEAVARIKFEPGTNVGRPVGMHGTAECVFRLDGESDFHLE